MEYSIDLAMQMLMKDSIAIESDSFLEDDQPVSQKVLAKISETFTRILNGLIKLIGKLIKIFKDLGRKFKSEVRKKQNKFMITDKYGYIPIIRNASNVIDLYEKTLIRLRRLDQTINSSHSLMDDAKDSLKKSAFQLKKQPSKREYYEEVIRCFDVATRYRDGLKTLLINVETNLKLDPDPKKYDIEFLEKFVSSTLDTKTKTLEDLKYELEVSKRNYSERKFLYRRMHKEDIKRNNDILTHTTNLLDIVAKFKDLYAKLLLNIESPENEDAAN